MKTCDQRFDAKWQERDDGCWVWTAAVSSSGYGNFWAKRYVRAHRYAHLRWIGPIPEGHDVHHNCQNRLCVNPLHIESMSRPEHMRISSPNTFKTHCIHGHEFSEANTWRTKGGKRHCRKCHARRQRERKARLKLRSTSQVGAKNDVPRKDCALARDALLGRREAFQR